MRRGAGVEAKHSPKPELSTPVDVHNMAYFEKGGDGIVIHNPTPAEGGGVVGEVEDNGKGVADVMILAGRPIGAPVVAQGTMVMNTPGEVSAPPPSVQRPASAIQHRLSNTHLPT